VQSALIIRPDGKCQKTVEFFTHQGTQAVGLPLVNVIVQEADCQAFIAKLRSASCLDIAVFTSTYSASFVLEAMQGRSWPADLTIIGIGSSTAAIFKSASIAATTPRVATSEGLLDMPELCDVAGKHIAIVKGVGGRTILAQQLKQRDAGVTEFDCYERLPNLAVVEQLRQNKQQIDCVVATSGELIALAVQHLSNSWCQKPWIVVSERIAQIARDKGIERVVVSPSARNEDLYATYKTL
jgi:uroporphyrinogen-III synthase